jgi:D-alanyl-D-alanine carboxypeptidase/D-alanyl-D-alanine-endopeptidase (penicillin-binding protein 4)
MRSRTLTRSLVAATTLAVTMTPVVGSIGSSISTGTGPVRAQAAGDAALVTALDQVLGNSALAGSMTAMQVVDGTTEAVIYSKNAGQRVIPASNEKLLTSAAALAYLGAGYRFHTTASYSGTKSGTTVTGNLILKGTGDPTLTDARFDTIAAKVAAAGITKVTGQLIADDSAFDHTQLGSNWGWDDESYAYGAPISALTAASTKVFDAGSVAVAAKPGTAKGTVARLGILPRNSYVKIKNNAVTGAAGSANTITAVRTHGTNTVVVSGSIPLGGATSTDLVSVENPTLLAASTFRAALTRHKVKVVGATVVKAGPASPKKIYDRASVPLRDLLVPFLKLSNNGHAEVLVKAMGATASGHAGNWTNGLAQERTTLAGLGVTTAASQFGDGSGLSRRDSVTTRQIATLLERAQSQPWFSAWYKALPIAGVDGQLVGGTLTHRFRGTRAANNLHAKTGTMAGVNALSGYVTDTTGRRLAFSIVSNNATANVAGILDQAALKLADAGSAAALATRSATPESRSTRTRQGQDVECSWVQAC